MTSSTKEEEEEEKEAITTGRMDYMLSKLYYILSCFFPCKKCWFVTASLYKSVLTDFTIYGQQDCIDVNRVNFTMAIKINQYCQLLCRPGKKSPVPLKKAITQFFTP